MNCHLFKVPIKAQFSSITLISFISLSSLTIKLSADAQSSFHSNDYSISSIFADLSKRLNSTYCSSHGDCPGNEVCLKGKCDCVFGFVRRLSPIPGLDICRLFKCNLTDDQACQQFGEEAFCSLNGRCECDLEDNNPSLFFRQYSCTFKHLPNGTRLNKKKENKFVVPKLDLSSITTTTQYKYTEKSSNEKWVLRCSLLIIVIFIRVLFGVLRNSDKSSDNTEHNNTEALTVASNNVGTDLDQPSAPLTPAEFVMIVMTTVSDSPEEEQVGIGSTEDSPPTYENAIEASDQVHLRMDLPPPSYSSLHYNT